MVVTSRLSCSRSVATKKSIVPFESKLQLVFMVLTKGLLSLPLSILEDTLLLF